jgi:hypothetical protein
MQLLSSVCKKSQYLSALGVLLGEAARGDNTLCVTLAAVTAAVGAGAAFTAIAAGSS